MKKYGVSSTGLIAPIIRKGDDLCKIVVDTVLNSVDNIEDKDIIGITESVVARAHGNYATIDEIAENIRKKMIETKGEITNTCVFHPIYSRNRFAMILKAIARASKKYVNVQFSDRDYVGNVYKDHPFTGMNYDEYYRQIVESEGKIFYATYDYESSGYDKEAFYIYASSTHIYHRDYHRMTGFDATLMDFCTDKCEYGLYGSNKATEETLKLFPNTEKAQILVENIQEQIKEKTGKTVEVMVYGDGCFKDPVGGIWEFADPVVSPAYTKGLEGSPNEIKLKAFADDKYKNLSGEDLSEAIKQEITNKDKDLKGNMASQGTTPRRYTDLLGSLMDLTSGSGDKGTPIIYVKRYFDNYAN